MKKNLILGLGIGVAFAGVSAFAGSPTVTTNSDGMQEIIVTNRPSGFQPGPPPTIAPITPLSPQQLSTVDNSATLNSLATPGTLNADGTYSAPGTTEGTSGAGQQPPADPGAEGPYRSATSNQAAAAANAKAARGNNLQNCKKTGYQNINGVRTEVCLDKDQDTDNCSNSSYWDSKSKTYQSYGSDCNSAFGAKDTATMVNGIAQVGGTALTNTAGSIATQKASQSGTQGAAYSGAATTMEISGVATLGSGAANLAMGYLQWKAADKAKQANGLAIKDAKAEGGLATSDAANASVHQANQEAATAAATEEGKAASQTKMGAWGSLAMGGVQLITGGLTMSAANQMKKTAAELNAASNAPSLAIPGDPFSNTAAAPAMGNTITGTGLPDSSASSAQPNAVPSGDLSGLVGPPTGAINPNGIVGAAPSPGVYSPTAAQAPGGGGGGDMGGSSTSDAKGDPEQQAKMASNERISYEGGSAAYAGGGNKGLGAADKGPDLTSMLAALLPQKEEAAGPQNSILNYANRSPASEGGYSYYDAGTNLFEHVSSRYLDKTKQLHL